MSRVARHAGVIVPMPHAAAAGEYPGGTAIHGVGKVGERIEEIGGGVLLRLRIGVCRIHEAPLVGNFADQREGMPAAVHGQLVDGHGTAHSQRGAHAAQQKRVHPGIRVHPMEGLAHATEQAVGRLNGLDVLWHIFRCPLQGQTGHY